MCTRIINIETDMVVLEVSELNVSRDCMFRLLAERAEFPNVKAMAKAYGGLRHLVVERNGIEVEDV